MSDPTIQTFCCHHTGSKEDLAVRIMNEFNTESYNTVCLVSSSIGILGSIYQVRNTDVFPLYYSENFTVYSCFQIFPCGSSNHPERLRNVTPNRGRHIIIWLAVADLLASLGKVLFFIPLSYIIHINILVCSNNVYVCIYMTKIDRNVIINSHVLNSDA